MRWCKLYVNLALSVQIRVFVLSLWQQMYISTVYQPIYHKTHKGNEISAQDLKMLPVSQINPCRMQFSCSQNLCFIMFLSQRRKESFHSYFRPLLSFHHEFMIRCSYEIAHEWILLCSSGPQWRVTWTLLTMCLMLWSQLPTMTQTLS